MPGQTGKKFTKREVEARRARVMKAVLRGVSRAELAQQENVSTMQICYDIKAVRKEWRESRIDDCDTLITQQLEQLDDVIKEAWIDWDASREDTVITEINTDGDSKKAKRTTRTNTGNPAYLEKILKALDQKSELQGLKKAPLKNPNDDDFTPEQQRDRFAQLLAAIAAVNDGRNSRPAPNNGGNGRVGADT